MYVYLSEILSVFVMPAMGVLILVSTAARFTPWESAYLVQVLAAQKMQSRVVIEIGLISIVRG